MGHGFPTSHSSPRGLITASLSTQAPSRAAGRRSFIAREVPVDSRAQGCDHSRHRHLLAPTPLLEPRTKSSRPTATVYSSHTRSYEFPQPKEARAAVRRHTASGSAAIVVRAVYIWGQASRKMSFQLPGGPELLAWLLTGATALVTGTPCPGAEPPSLTALPPKPVAYLATRLRGQRPPQLLTPKMPTNKAISRVHVWEVSAGQATPRLPNTGSSPIECPRPPGGRHPRSHHCPQKEAEVGDSPRHQVWPQAPLPPSPEPPPCGQRRLFQEDVGDSVKSQPKSQKVILWILTN